MFVDLVWQIVQELKKEEFSFLETVAYDTKSEDSCLTSDVEKKNRMYSILLNKQVELMHFDRVVKCERSFSATKNTYIERNQQLIDESDICLFYYDEHYKPAKRKISKKGFSEYQPKSGTGIAYDYAKRKNKVIINVKDILSDY